MMLEVCNLQHRCLSVTDFAGVDRPNHPSGYYTLHGHRLRFCENGAHAANARAYPTI
jgi:hypothetical protein